VAVGAVNVGEREQAQRFGTLEELVAERIAREAARIVEEHIREIVSLSDLDPDEVYGFMNSEEAAEFLGLPYTSFREIAPNLPRHAITPARFGYLRRELLERGKDR
jgi:2-iminoacetate synthase ThiH